MKKYCIVLGLILSSTAFAQKGIEGMVQSERNFAAYAVANNTVDAFIKFADSTGVVFEKGQPVNAKSSWSKKPKRPGILNWRPLFAEVASSGDLGYTTGQWTFQPKTITDSIVATGHFFTVWQLDKNGEWHFLLDMGTSKAPIDSTSRLQKIQSLSTKATKSQEAALLDMENAFITAYNKNPQQAYASNLSQHSILNREQMNYATLPADQAAIIASYTQPVKLTPQQAGIATSGDLGYVYGEAVYNGKKENYLHIWRHEKKGWKLALELIQH